MNGLVSLGELTEPQACSKLRACNSGLSVLFTSLSRVDLAQMNKLDRMEVDLAQEAGTELPPELEACLEALFPDRDPLTVYRALCGAVDDLCRAQRQLLN